MESDREYSLFNETESNQRDNTKHSVTYFSPSTTNYVSDDRPAVRLDSMEAIGLVTFMVVLDLVIIVGNAMVIGAVFTHSKLRCTTTNKFVVSLAVADLMVGLVVLPFSSANQVLHYWPFGGVWCRAWLAIDVWLCTASIFNLCAISLDRYLAISRPIKYPTVMSPFRARLLIVAVWILSFVICFPPLIGNWTDSGQHLQNDQKHPRLSAVPRSLFHDVISFEDDLSETGNVISAVTFSYPENEDAGYFHVEKKHDGGSTEYARDVDPNLPDCALTSDPAYIIYSACGSFWVPMLGMVVFYGKIYKTAVAATAAMKRGFIEKKTTGGGGGLACSTSENTLCMLRIHRGGSTGNAGSMTRHSNGCISELLPRPSAELLVRSTGTQGTSRCSIDSRITSIRTGETSIIGPSRITRPDVTSQPLPKIVITASVSCADDVASERKFSQLQDDHQQKDHVEFGDDDFRGEKKTKKRKQVTQKCEFRKKSSRDRNSSFGVTDSHCSTMMRRDGCNSTTNRKNSYLGLLDTDASSSSNSDQAVASGKRSSIQLVAARFAKLHIISQLRSLNKEKRAAKTVGIIVGCFIVCWAPFFTVYLFQAFCPNCTPTSVFHVFFWLGYCNSAANPFIYGLCSLDFRYAFKKFLRCDCLFGRNHSLRRGGFIGQSTNGQVMGLLQTMTLQLVARATGPTSSP